MDKDKKVEIRFKVSKKKIEELKHKAKKLDISVTTYAKIKLFGEE